MRVAADCNSIKVCFPVAVIYFVVDGTTSRGFSDNFWIQMRVREMAGHESFIPLTALGFVNDVFLVAGTIASSFSGSFWTHLVQVVKEFAQP